MGIWAATLGQPPEAAADPPIIGCFPSADRAFCRFVAAMFDRLRPSRPEDLQATLRSTHPFAVVRPRELAHEATPMWYVYRDGAALARWATGSWWQATDVAEVRLDNRGVFVGANRVARRIAAGGSSDLLGRSFHDMALPGDVGLALLWRTLRESGRLDTVYTFSTASGIPVTVEIHAEASDHGAVAYWRPIGIASA